MRPPAGRALYRTVAAGELHTCAITTTGDAHCWGGHAIGVSWTQRTPWPVSIADGRTYASISAGTARTCAGTVSGSVFCYDYAEDRLLKPHATGRAAGACRHAALDKPVSVLQLTGALIDREGRALRIGAEGILARRASILLSAVGAQRLISDEDVEQLRTMRRQDLPGTPLVWQAALDTLVRELIR